MWGESLYQPLSLYISKETYEKVGELDTSR